ncbi:gliding motility-associated C-terminal domain-containing protein [Sporocytophaga myxococcoides]|uniref:gliding motility-associated C-terminal domain-containing protein n=1 Tax=Sporocytophaga myxococcoides TaxID=153721 RepID=UPI00041CC81E|nr:gliding motility-associated C-terminal domain-containing protein [Sporocytophaga myxococcoides]
MNKRITALVFLLGIYVQFQSYAQCDNCTTSYAANASIVATANNQTICISGGSTFTFSSTYRNVTVKICAPNVQLSNVQISTGALNNTIESFGDNTRIVNLVTEPDTFSFIAHNTGALLSSATINGMSFFKTTKGATLTIAQNLNPGNKIFITAEDDSKINTADITSNKGGRIIVGKKSTFTSTGKVFLQNEGFIFNTGDVTAAGDFTVQNAGNAMTNYCGESTIKIGGKLTINSGKIYSAGIIIAGTIAVNSNAGPIYLNQGAVMQATTLETNNTANLFRGDSISAGECALFKITSYGSFNAPLSNTPKIKYCGPATSQLGQATPDCNCATERQLCVPLCEAPTTVTITGPLSNICAGDSAVLTANPTGLKAGDTYTYSWYKDSVAPANLIVTKTNIATLTVKESSTYFVVVANTINPIKCFNQNTTGFKFTVHPNPPKPEIVASGPLTFCNGGSVDLTASSLSFTGGTFTWSTGSTANPLHVTTSGKYTVTYVSDDVCSSPVSSEVTVVVHPNPPKPTIVASGPLIFCDGGSVDLTASSSGFTGGIFTWSTGSTANPLHVTSSGKYAVSYVSGNACPSVGSDSITVIVHPVPPKPTIVANGPLIFCDGGSVDLTASSLGFTGGTFTWSTGSTANPLHVTTSGKYVVTYKSSELCSSAVSDSVTIIVHPNPPKPQIVASGPLTFCDGGSVDLTASSSGFTGGTFTWSTGSNANPLHVTTSGKYTVTYVSDNVCSSPVSAELTVVVYPNPPKPKILASGPLTFCNGGSVDLTASSLGFTGGTFTWSTGSIANPLHVTTSGKYTVTYKSSNLCPSVVSDSVTVIVHPNPPKPEIKASGPLTFCDGGSVDLTASSLGFTGGTFTWSTGSTANPLHVTTSGKYTVTYVSDDICSSPVSTEVTVVVHPNPPKPKIVASGPLTFCDGGSVDLTASSLGFTGGTFTWSTGSTANPLHVTTSGKYAVTYKSNNACPSLVSDSLTVVVYPNPPKPEILASGPLTFCDGGSVDLTASSLGFTGGTFTWSTGSTSNPLHVTTSGKYTVNYKSDNACPSPASAEVIVVVNPNPPKPKIVASGPLTFCDGGSVNLTASSLGFTGGTFTWSTGSTANPLHVTKSGKYSVIYKTSNLCPSVVSDSVTVIVNPNPNKPKIAASGPLTFCDGGSVELTASSLGFTGGTFTWSTGSTDNPLKVTTSGRYSVSYVSNDVCGSVTSDSITVVVYPIPPKPKIVASGPLIFCDGGSVDLTASSLGFTGGKFTWSTGSTDNPLHVTTSGKFTVMYVSDNACPSGVSDSVTVIINPNPPKPEIAASGPSTFCDGGSVNLTASSLGFTGGTFTWSTGSTANPLHVTKSGKYSVTYKTSNLCPSVVSDSVTVIVNPNPNKPKITVSGPLTFCDGGSVDLTASSLGFTGGTFTWSTGSTDNPLKVTTSGRYSVSYVSDDVCGSVTSDSITVVVNPIPPKPEIAASGPLTFCDGGSVDLTASSLGFTGGTFTWSTGSTDNPLKVTTSGKYVVSYVSDNVCPSGASDSIIVIVNPIPPKPEIAASGPLTFCDGGSIDLTASSLGFTGGTFTWSTGSTDNPLHVTVSGKYSVSYVSDNVCPSGASDSITVVVNPIPPKPEIAASGPLTFCDGGSVDLTASSLGFTGGTFTWSTGSTDNPLHVTISGKYVVSYVSDSICPSGASDSIIVVVHPNPPKPEISASGPLTFCDGGSVDLTARSSGFTGGTFTWSTGSTDNPLHVTTSGKYKVSYVSDDVCPSGASDSITVIVNPVPPKPKIAASGPLIFCDGGSVDLTASSLGFTGGTFTWSTGSTDNPLHVTISGKYVVSYVSDSICPSGASDSITVVVHPNPPKPEISASGPLTFCDGGSVDLTASSSGFTGGKFTWSTGSTDNPLHVTTSGKYIVNYVSDDVCPSGASDSVTVVVNPNPPKPKIAASGPLIFCDGGSVDLTASSIGFTGGTFTWSTGSTDNPLHVTTSGKYTVSYVSDSVCPSGASDSITVVVHPNPPKPEIAASGPLTFCDGGSVDLIASSLGFTGGTFTWSTGSTDNPLKVTTSGKYTVKYVSADLCPSDTSLSVTVTVNPIPPQPTIKADGPMIFCPGGTVGIHAESTGFTGTFEWFKGNVALGSDASITLSEAGNYTVYFTSDSGCVANLSTDFAISHAPDNSPVDLGKDIITCKAYIDLYALSPAVGKGVWLAYDANDAIITNPDSDSIRVSGLEAGSIYSFIYTISGGCGPDKSDTITITAGLPGFDITSLETPMDTQCVGVSRRVTVFAKGGSDHYSYEWINAASMDTLTTAQNYLDIIPNGLDNVYYVYVNDLDQPGCKTFQDTLTIHAVHKQTLFIPNLITPNGDGKNDELRIVEANNYDNLMFPAGSFIEIYNRWGNRVYEAKNYDGTWKGNDTVDGMYYYYLKTGCGHDEYKGWLQILSNTESDLR